MIRASSLIFISTLFVSAGLLGCANTEDTKPSASASSEVDSPDEPAPAQEPAQEPAAVEEPPADADADADADAAPITVTGTLTYSELPRTKSVEAYLGKEFTLVDASGTEHNLKSSDTVSHKELVDRSGQTVKVTCVPYPEKQPPPHMQAPTNGPDGGLMPHPAGCRVTALAAAD